MQWQPESGHVPRGFCGETGKPSDVRLVLMVAEPGDSQTNEIYPVVAALGGKAHNRMKALQRRYIRAGSVAPPGCNQRNVRESWKAIAAAVHAGGE